MVYASIQRYLLPTNAISAYSFLTSIFWTLASNDNQSSLKITEIGKQRLVHYNYTKTSEAQQINW